MRSGAALGCASSADCLVQIVVCTCMKGSSWRRRMQHVCHSHNDPARLGGCCRQQRGGRRGCRLPTAGPNRRRPPPARCPPAAYCGWSATKSCECMRRCREYYCRGTGDQVGCEGGCTAPRASGCGRAAACRCVHARRGLQGGPCWRQPASPAFGLPACSHGLPACSLGLASLQQGQVQRCWAGCPIMPFRDGVCLCPDTRSVERAAQPRLLHARGRAAR